jgi:hypothetical protein
VITRDSIPIITVTQNQLAELRPCGIRKAGLEAWNPICYHFASGQNGGPMWAYVQVTY